MAKGDCKGNEFESELPSQSVIRAAIKRAVSPPILYHVRIQRGERASERAGGRFVQYQRSHRHAYKRSAPERASEQAKGLASLVNGPLGRPCSPFMRTCVRRTRGGSYVALPCAHAYDNGCDQVGNVIIINVLFSPVDQDS